MTKINSYSNNVNVNRVTRTITITKKFYKDACRYGTEEYAILQNVTSENPDCKIVIKTTKTGDRFKGLTYDFMEKYIKNHDEDGSVWSEYRALRGYTVIDGVELELDDSLSYGEIKAWFLGQFSEFDAFNASRKNIVAMAKMNRRSLKVVA